MTLNDKKRSIKAAAKKLHGPEPIPQKSARRGNPYLHRFLKLMNVSEKIACKPGWEWDEKGGGILYCTRWERRRLMVKVFSWAIPTDKAIGLLRDHSPIIEIGAGGGYWAWMIEQAGGTVYAYDSWWEKYKPRTKWTTVKHGGPGMIKRYPDATLFLCWPPYDDAMALKCLQNYTGEFFFYEGEGEFGCTGDEAFHNEIKLNWKAKKTICVPTWPGIYDKLILYQRRKEKAK